MRQGCALFSTRVRTVLKQESQTVALQIHARACEGHVTARGSAFSLEKGAKSGIHISGIIMGKFVIFMNHKIKLDRGLI